MREIKFRAYDKINKKMIKEIASINFYLKEFSEKDKNTYHFYTFKNSEIMQYTGLKDSKGKEIYEGDIIFSVNENGIYLQEVGFGEDDREYTNILNGFKIIKSRELDIEMYSEKLKGKHIYLIEKFNIPVKKFDNEKYIEDCQIVIGNIYENKELLEE